MVDQTTGTTATFPEDWNAGIDAGSTFMLDPMHFPYPLTPLTASTMGPAFGAGTLAAFREMHLPMASVDVIHRNHYRFERWAPMVPSNEEEARQIGEATESSTNVEIGRMLDRWHGEHKPAISAHHRRLQEMNVEGSTPIELQALIGEVHAIHEDLWTIHFRVAMPMLLSMQLFDEVYSDIFGGADGDSHALLVGSLSESVKAGIGLSDLAASARELGLIEVLRDTDGIALLNSLEESEAGRTFLVQLHDYLRDYGLRQDLFEFSTPTWLEDPSFALVSVRNYLQTGHDARAEHEEMSRSAERALTAAREVLASYPEAVRGQFEAMLQFGRQGAFLQEEHNFYIDQRGMALIRLFYLRVGQRFVDAGLIEETGDIFLLTIEEIHRVVGQEFMTSKEQLGALIRERRNELASARMIAPPPFVGDPPVGPPPTSNPMERAMVRFFGGPPQQAEDSNRIKGNSGSRGVVTGIARVARTLEEAKDLRPGEILVATTTMPAWTPLFGVAAAVVTETGGPLSHCAIVAREYAIPAVVGAHGATYRIQTGQTITVDGTTGIVTLGS